MSAIPCWLSTEKKYSEEPDQVNAVALGSPSSQLSFWDTEKYQGKQSIIIREPKQPLQLRPQVRYYKDESHLAEAWKDITPWPRSAIVPSSLSLCPKKMGKQSNCLTLQLIRSHFFCLSGKQKLYFLYRLFTYRNRLIQVSHHRKWVICLLTLLLDKPRSKNNLFSLRSAT